MTVTKIVFGAHPYFGNLALDNCEPVSAGLKMLIHLINRYLRFLSCFIDCPACRANPAIGVHLNNGATERLCYLLLVRFDK
jgi:hypothetical protein